MGVERMSNDLAMTVVKIGGALMDSDSAMADFWTSMQALSKADDGDRSLVLVHGAGPQTTRLTLSQGREPQIVHGRRITTPEDLQALLWAGCGEINTRLVAQAGAHGFKAVGLTGADAQLLRVSRRPPWHVDGNMIDFGEVGDVESCDGAVAQSLAGLGMLSIVAPVGSDSEGALYNVNADTVAAEIAKAVRADSLIFVTESGGLLETDAPDADLIGEVSKGEVRSGIASGRITGGMRVKLSVGLSAQECGVNRIQITGPASLHLPDSGTRIIPE